MIIVTRLNGSEIVVNADLIETVESTSRGRCAKSPANELFARYGGEEFALVASDCNPEDLIIAGERLRGAVEALRVDSASGPLQVTATG